MDLRERTGISHRHPWETARRDHVLSVLQTEIDTPIARVLDAGSGDSFVAEGIANLWPQAEVVCWDTHYDDADLQTAPRGLSRTRTEPVGAFDVILALDVIEHVEDDGAFLRILRGLVGVGAVLVVTVPAYQRLFTRHDVLLGHYRRYARRGLASTVETAGWEVKLVGGLFATLLPVRFLSVLSERGKVSPGDVVSDHGHHHLGTWRFGAFITAAVRWVLHMDAALARLGAGRLSRGLPGLSVYCLAAVTERQERPGRPL